jgi:hypothetical protein
MGTDRLFVSPNLLVIADHGSPSLQKYSANLDDSFSNKLLALLEHIFSQDPLKYCTHLSQLIRSAVSMAKVEGSCTLTVAVMHPQTGEVSLYYIGDSLYAIFRKDRV